jgi:hypothetical protein
VITVLCFTWGEWHREDNTQGRYGDRHISGFLLLDHDCHESHVCVGFSGTELLRRSILLALPKVAVAVYDQPKVGGLGIHVSQYRQDATHAVLLEIALKEQND